MHSVIKFSIPLNRDMEKGIGLLFLNSSQKLSHILVSTGVSVKKGNELVNIYCPTVISDAGVFNTYQHLVPESVRCLPGKRLVL